MTTSDKPPTSFRLSEQAHANLEAITAAAGCTKTAAVEIGIALVRNLIEASPQWRDFTARMIKYYQAQKDN